MGSRILSCCVLLAAFLGSPIFLTHAQVNTASIRGTVTDSTGAVVADASVNASNNATGAKATTLTNAQGIYSFPVLNVGVAHLPQRFTPGTACTDVELLTLDLQFESLVKPVYKQRGQRWQRNAPPPRRLRSRRRAARRLNRPLTRRQRRRGARSAVYSGQG